MTHFSEKLARLSRVGKIARARTSASKTELQALTGFGSNPGDLTAWCHIPKSMRSKAALVVVLHGCTQTAAGYDAGSGWSQLADEYGFAVLFPEQQRSNNPNLCFNWFDTGDISRGSGEVMSILEMVGAMVAEHHLDDARIFVTGLSAGGAMALAMLSAYPDVFAGGAVIAGLPYATAGSVPEAFDRMRGRNMPETAELQEQLRSASDHAGPWPTLSVWHGTADQTVVAANADAIIEQWRGVHEVEPEASNEATLDGHVRRIWRDANGDIRIESYSIAGMGHGTPINQASGYGKRAPFMIDVGISSTELIARNWGITASFELQNAAPAKSAATPLRASSRSRAKPAASHGPVATGVQKVIEDALRAAGLMK